MLTKEGIKISMCNEVHEKARGRPVILKESTEQLKISTFNIGISQDLMS